VEFVVDAAVDMQKQLPSVAGPKRECAAAEGSDHPIGWATTRGGQSREPSSTCNQLEIF